MVIAVMASNTRCTMYPSGTRQRSTTKAGASLTSAIIANRKAGQSASHRNVTCEALALVALALTEGVQQSEGANSRNRLLGTVHLDDAASA